MSTLVVTMPDGALKTLAIGGQAEMFRQGIESAAATLANEATLQAVGQLADKLEGGAEDESASGNIVIDLAEHGSLGVVLTADATLIVQGWQFGRTGQVTVRQADNAPVGGYKLLPGSGVDGPVDGYALDPVAGATTYLHLACQPSYVLDEQGNPGVTHVFVERETNTVGAAAYADPGKSTLIRSGKLEAAAYVAATTTGAAKAYSLTDLFQHWPRANGDGAMTDTLPPPTIPGARIAIANRNINAGNLTLSCPNAAVPTSPFLIDGVASVVWEPGRSVEFVALQDGSGWRSLGNGLKQILKQPTGSASVKAALVMGNNTVSLAPVNYTVQRFQSSYGLSGELRFVMRVDGTPTSALSAALWLTVVATVNSVDTITGLPIAATYEEWCDVSPYLVQASGTPTYNIWPNTSTQMKGRVAAGDNKVALMGTKSAAAPQHASGSLFTVGQPFSIGASGVIWPT